MKFYLVDYENTHESGLVGYDKLDSNAIVYIFISKNTKSLNPKFLSNLSTTIKSIEVESNKKNALDSQLIFYAGKLAAENPGCEISVVSKDQGYDCLPKFVLKNSNAKFNRVLNLSGYNDCSQKNDLKKRVAEALKDIKYDKGNKDELIDFIVDKIQTLKTKNAINNNLQKFLRNDVLLKSVYKAIKPLLKEKK